MPNTWLKSDDKSGLFNFITRENKLLKLKCYDNTTTNSIFKGHAQTHCGCFLIEKGGKTTDFDHFSYYLNAFSRCSLLERGNVKSICVLDTIIERKIINKLKDVFERHNIDFTPLLFHKTSTLSKKISISTNYTDIFSFKNVYTCVFYKNHTKKYDMPYIKYEYSDLECPYYGKPKIILLHGMYGIPFIDKAGDYGISRRDKYVILSENVENMECVAWFLSSPIALFMFENYKYRMCFLEKAGFEWLVDVSLLMRHGFPYKDADLLFQWFEFNKNERDYIMKFERKQLIG
jgi:hypothetical protein